MKLVSIEIKNYRGVKNSQKIDVTDFTTIVGKNDSGKSIILHAIASFLDNGHFPMCSEDFNFYRGVGENIEIVCCFEDESIKEKLKDVIKKDRKKDIGIEEDIYSIIKDSNKLFIKKIWNTPDKKPTSCQIKKEDFEEIKYRDLVQKGEEDLKKIIEDLKIEIPPDRPGKNSKSEKAKFIGEYLINNGCRRLDIWAEGYKIDEILPQVEFFQADHVISPDTSFNTSFKSETKDFFQKEIETDGSKLKSVGENASREIQKEADEISKYMQEHVRDLEKIEVTPNFNWVDAIKDISVKFKFTKDATSIPMQNKGAGYRRLFMVGRFRYLASKNIDQEAIYMIEEPETFLHPSAQQELLNSLIELSKDNQIIITTHSPIFAGASNANKIILCKEENQSVYVQNETEFFIEEIINELGIKPSYNLRDEFEKIVFIEGPGDDFFVKKIAEKFLGKPIENKKALFLFGGGDTLSNFIDIDYFSKCKRPLFLIVDSDKYDISKGKNEGKDRKIENNKKLKEKFEKKHGATGYILKKSCIENYYHPRAVERIFSLENKKIQQAVFSDDDNIQDIFKNFPGITNYKNNKKIFEEMTKEEWGEVLEKELVDFMEKIIK